MLTAEEIEALQKRPIDFSDIPELTEDQIMNMYPRNWRKQAVSARLGSDTIEWLKTPGEKGYLRRLNAVLRWARLKGCPISQL